MAGQQIRWKLLCSLAALISSVTTQPSTPSFVDQPISETLEEGDTLILRCSFGNFTSDFNAQWVRDDVVFSKDFEVYREQRLVNFFGVTEPSRYSVIGNASLGEFYLQIRHTTVSDAGEYACRLSDTIGQLSDSDTAVIQINSLPETSYPRCFPTDLDSFYTEGETLRVECVYRGATEPLPSLTWVRRNQPLNGERLYDSLSDVAYNWTFVSDDHGRSILCVYNYGEVETQRCEIGPVTVYYKPTIQMDPFIYVTVGQSVQITAEVDSYPAPYSYIWEINNLNVENEQRIFVNGNILTILDAYETDGNATITCTALHVVGNATAYTRLHVTAPPSTVKTVTTTRTTTTSIHSTLNNQQYVTSPTPAVIDVQRKAHISMLVIGVTAGGAAIFFLAVVVAVCVFVSSCRDKRRRSQAGVERDDKMFEINMYRSGDDLPQVTNIAPVLPRLEPKQESPQNILYGSHGRRVHVKDIFSEQAKKVDAENKHSKDEVISEPDKIYTEESVMNEFNDLYTDPDIIQDTQDRSSDSASEKRRSQTESYSGSDILFQEADSMNSLSASPEQNSNSEDNYKNYHALPRQEGKSLPDDKSSASGDDAIVSLREVIIIDKPSDDGCKNQRTRISYVE